MATATTQKQGTEQLNSLPAGGLDSAVRSNASTPGAGNAQKTQGNASSLASSKVDFGTKNSNPRQERVSKITIHHMAGNMGAISCANMHKNGGGASAQYYIGSDGSICAGVSETRRAWTSSSPSNDHKAITFEVANNSAAPNWTISDAAYNSMIALCRDICSRYGISPHFDGSASASLTAHYMFASTACPGPYIKGKLQSGQIERDIKGGGQSNDNAPGQQGKPQQNTPQPEQNSNAQSYTVRSGDSLSGIADRFNVSGGYQALAKYNGISNPNLISVGQVIKIPGSGSAGPSNQPAPKPTQSSPVQTYTVRSGDSLSEIADRFNVSGGYQALAKHNGISNPNFISVGQVLSIPGSGAPAPSKTQPSPQPSQSASQTYTVRSGDSLSAIADRFNISGGYQALAKFNGISNPNLISVGQVLKIPTKGGSSQPQNQPAPQPTPSPSVQTYTVRSGDSLSAIADRFNVPGGYQALAKYNGISNPSVISVGQVLKIPTSSSSGGGEHSQGDSAPKEYSSPGGSEYPAVASYNIRPIYNYLVNECFSDHPYKKALACGFLGNIYTESHYQPGAEQNKGSEHRGGKGIVQWDDRKYKLYEHCGATYREKNKWAVLEKQLTFIKKELFGSEKGAYNKMTQGTTANTVAGARQAAYIIARYYERCAVPSNPERQDKAEENFNSL